MSVPPEPTAKSVGMIQIVRLVSVILTQIQGFVRLAPQGKLVLMEEIVYQPTATAIIVPLTWVEPVQPTANATQLIATPTVALTFVPMEATTLVVILTTIVNQAIATAMFVKKLITKAVPLEVNVTLPFVAHITVLANLVT